MRLAAGTISGAPPCSNPSVTTMNPAVQTQEKSVQPGSSRYYSLLFLPATAREAATSLYRLANELNTLGSTSSEAAVVHSKLAW
jgi:phytoene synthase